MNRWNVYSLLKQEAPSVDQAEIIKSISNIKADELREGVIEFLLSKKHEARSNNGGNNSTNNLNVSQ